MANYSDFLVYVDWQDFDKAKDGDADAIARLRAKLDGVDIYFHGFHTDSGEIGVTVSDVICAGIITRVTLHTEE